MAWHVPERRGQKFDFKTRPQCLKVWVLPRSCRDLNLLDVLATLPQESKELQPSNLALETLDIAANSRVAVAKASTQRINSQRILADETLGKGIALTRSNLASWKALFFFLEWHVHTAKIVVGRFALKGCSHRSVCRFPSKQSVSSCSGSEDQIMFIS